MVLTAARLLTNPQLLLVLQSTSTSVLGHFGPRTEVHIHFSPWSGRSSVTSVLCSVTLL